MTARHFCVLTLGFRTSWCWYSGYLLWIHRSLHQTPHSAGRNRHDTKTKDADLDDKRAVLGTNFGSIKVLDLNNMQLVSSGY